MKTDYADLHDRLTQALAVSEKRIALLNQIMQREDKRAARDESVLLDELVVPPASTEIVALMLEAKAEKRKKKNRTTYDPFVMDSRDELSRLEFNFKIAESIASNQPCHYDFIIKKEAHCTPMQIDFDGEEIRLFYIDAAGDDRNLAYAESFAMGDKSRRFYQYTAGGIQIDQVSCAIFSIQHLNNLSNIFQMSKTQDTDTPVSGLNSIMGPVFLKNVQSISRFKDYFDLTVDKNKSLTLQDYFSKYSITVDVSDAGDGSVLKTRNYAITYKNHKYLQAALVTLEQLKSSGYYKIEQVIDARTSSRDKNLYGKPGDDDAIQTRMIKAFVQNHDTEKMNVLIKYAISQEQYEILDQVFQTGARDVIINTDYINRYEQKRSFVRWAINTGDLKLVAHVLPSAGMELDLRADVLNLYPEGTTFEDLIDNDPGLALHLAARNQDSDSLSAILDGLGDKGFAAVTEKGPGDRTPLHLVARNLVCLQVMLDKIPKDKIFAAVMKKDRNGRSVLYEASLNPACLIAIIDRLPEDKLLEAVMEKEYDHLLLMHSAASNKTPDSMIAILDRLPDDKHFDVVMLKSFGNTVLHKVARRVASLTAILDRLSEDKIYDAVMEPGKDKKTTVLDIAASNQACLSAILVRLPVQQCFAAIKYLAERQDALSLNSQLNEIKALVLDKINALDNRIPDLEKSRMEAIKRNINSSVVILELKEYLSELETLSGYQAGVDFKTRYRTQKTASDPVNHVTKHDSDSDDESLKNYF